jgi:hypothetical protein
METLEIRNGFSPHPTSHRKTTRQAQREKRSSAADGSREARSVTTTRASSASGFHPLNWRALHSVSHLGKRVSI